MNNDINNLAKLRPYERAAFYRRCAAQAESSAKRALTPESRASYLALADAWRALADQVLEDQAYGERLAAATTSAARGRSKSTYKPIG